MTSENIKDTIAKLLALAGSPNEHEARAALLKARDLMAKHKLREIDIERSESVTVIERLTGITCTKMTNSWVVRLSGIIALNYCCRSYRSHVARAKKSTIGLVGLDSDIDVCENILNYAYDCAARQCKSIRAANKERYTAKAIRQMENAYGNGFCVGIEKAYREQDAEHQEYGLVLVTPQPVLDAVERMSIGKGYGTVNYDGRLRDYAQLGYKDGLRFDPSAKLPGRVQA